MDKIKQLMESNKMEINNLNNRLNIYLEDLQASVNSKDIYSIINFTEEKLKRVKDTYNKIEFLELENKKLSNILEG